MDYVALSKEILLHLFQKKDIHFLSQYVSKDVKVVGIHTNKPFLEVLKNYEQSLSFYQLLHSHFDILEQKEASTILTGEFQLLVNDKEKINYQVTLVYHVNANNPKITYMHLSYPQSTQSRKEIAYEGFQHSFLAGLCSYDYNEHFPLRFVNDTLCLMLGYTKEEFIDLCQNNGFRIVYQEDQQLVQYAIAKSIHQDHVYHVEYRAIKKDGNLLWVMEQGETIVNDNGDIVVNAFVCDISSLKKSELDLAVQKQKYSLALKDNSITILEYDIKNDRVIIDIQEESKKKIYDHYLDYIFSERSTVFKEDRQLVKDLFTRKIKGPIEIREHIRGTNQYLRKSIDAIIIHDEKGEPAIVLATAKDITTEWNKNAVLQQKVQRDALTHILNLEGGKEKIEDYLSQRQSHESFAFMILDIDYFKAINDNHGHLFGNNVLVAFAKTLASHIRDNDIVARIGGDEFIILLRNIQREQTLSKTQSIVEAVRAIPLEKGITLTTSIGVFVADDENALYTFEEMFRNADLALYQAKKHGRNGFQVYDEKKDKQKMNEESFDDLYDRITHTIHDENLMIDDVKLMMKFIGEHYHFDRISHMEINADTREYIHTNLWVSSRAYDGDVVKGTLEDKDYHQLCSCPMKVVRFSHQTFDLSYQLKETIKHGVSKSILFVYINKYHFLSFVDYQHHRDITNKDEQELIELVNLLKTKKI